MDGLSFFGKPIRYGFSFGSGAKKNKIDEVCFQKETPLPWAKRIEGNRLCLLYPYSDTDIHKGGSN